MKTSKCFTLKIKFRLMDKQSFKMNGWVGRAMGGGCAGQRRSSIALWAWHGSYVAQKPQTIDPLQTISQMESLCCTFIRTCMSNVFAHLFLKISFEFHAGFFSCNFCCLLSLLNWTICCRPVTSRANKLRFLNAHMYVATCWSNSGGYRDTIVMYIFMNWWSNEV